MIGPWNQSFPRRDPSSLLTDVHPALVEDPWVNQQAV